MTVDQYTSSKKSRLNILKRELASAVKGTVTLKDHEKELLASLEDGATAGGPAESGPTYEAEVKSLGVENVVVPEIKSLGTDDLTIYNLEDDMPDEETSTAHKNAHTET